MISKKKWALIIALVLIVPVIAFPALFVFYNGKLLFRFSNPVDDYAKQKNLPHGLIDVLKPLGYDAYMDDYEKALVDDLSQMGNYVNSSSAILSVNSIVKDGIVTWAEVPSEWDTDHDYISDYQEITKYNANYTKVDSDSGGVDDFNEIFTYRLNPHDPQDDVEFMKKIPNVTAEHWSVFDGGIGPYFVDFNVEFAEISMRDPLIQYYAKKAEIKWVGWIINDGKIGNFIVDGKPIWNAGKDNERSVDQPSYYFTHGRTGNCVEFTGVSLAILTLMGYKTIEVDGIVPVINGYIANPELSNNTMGHAWSEVLINGGVYVVNFNVLEPREGFYEKNGWTLNPDYNPDWYKG